MWGVSEKGVGMSRVIGVWMTCNRLLSCFRGGCCLVAERM